MCVCMCTNHETCMHHPKACTHARNAPSLGFLLRLATAADEEEKEEVRLAEEEGAGGMEDVAPDTALCGCCCCLCLARRSSACFS